MLREVQAELQETTDCLENIAVTQKTISQTGVQEIAVSLQDIVNGGHPRQLLLKGTPVWLQNLHCHVVLETLDKIEHSLQEGKRRDVPGERMSE